MTLVVAVSMRVLPSPERHMRDADWVGGPPAAGCVLLLHSEHEGGAGGGICGGWPTAAISLARPARVVCELPNASIDILQNRDKVGFLNPSQ
jgi:hypothetical protein